MHGTRYTWIEFDNGHFSKGRMKSTNPFVTMKEGKDNSLTASSRARPSTVGAQNTEELQMQGDQDHQHTNATFKKLRKILKPGLTAKKKERYFVEHNYHDHADDEETDVGTFDLIAGAGDSEGSTKEGESRKPEPVARGGPALSFPFKLHDMLVNTEIDGYDHVASWQSHGRCFMIRDIKGFTTKVLPRYFMLSKITSFLV
jgi:hypothetical protein